LEAKLQQLIKHYFQSERELVRLREENAGLKALLHDTKEKTQQLAQTIDVLKIKALTENDTTKKDLEKRINTYLREIDKCLTMLQS